MENGDVVPTYAEAFPPLAAPASGVHQDAQPSWPVKAVPSSTVGQVGMKAIPSSNVTQVFHVPLEERRFQATESTFGNRQSEIVRDIMDRTGCSIELSQTKDHTLTIMVSGRLSSVQQARRDLLTKLQTQAHIELKIPKEHHKNILGKQGTKLKAIEMQTATKISVPRADDASDVVKITGTKEGVDKARHQIQVISDEQAKLAFERLPLDKEYHPFINGPGGAQAKQISEQTGARINIPPSSLNKNEISVAGDKEAVAMAVAQIQKIYREMVRTCSTVAVEVKKSQHKYIIGPKGQGLQEILSKTGVWVDVPSQDTDSNTITLRGPQEKLGIALTQVYEKANSVVMEEVVAPGWLHRFIIGRKGQNVQKITQDLPRVHVEFNSDLNKIILEGPPGEVTQAKEAFVTFTEDLVATMDFAEINIDQKYHRHIIGKGGSNVSRIKNETGTSIIIPPDENKSDVIRIEGDPKGVQAAKTMLLDMAAKMENERSKDLIIDQRLHKQIIGTKGETIKEIRDRFNGLQIGFPNPSEKKDIVTVRGPKEDVEKCASYLKKFSAELDAASYHEDVKIFKKFHGSIIGKGGATLKKIREETSTRITIPSENSDSDVIVVIGRKENVEKARTMLKAIEKEMASIVDVKVEIPHQLHTAIIGPKGKLVRAVMEECGGVRIRFPPTDSKSDEVTLHGPKDDVEKARTHLMELATEQALQNHCVELKCKPEYHRFLIGRGGSNIRKVRDQFGARVLFPQKGTDDDPETIMVIGVKAKAEETKVHLEKLIKDLDNTVELEMVVDPKYYSYFIARRGQLIHEIAEENGGVIISFPRANSESNKVVLKGAKQCIEGARTRILEIVEDLEAQVSIECVIHHKYHRSVLGAKGANVQAITQDHNVSIKFPEREGKGEGQKGESQKTEGAQTTAAAATTNGIAAEDSGTPDPRDVIVITGRKENAEAAKQALLDLVPISIKHQVPLEYHGMIIGSHGKDIRTMMEEYDVSIAVPPSEEQQDTITITGTAKNCEEAKEALQRRVKQLDAEKEERELRSFTTTIKVDPKYHPNIIGRKGATIQKLRDDHDVRVRLPSKEDANPDEITITGYEHQVNAAKEEILKIVQNLADQVSQEVTLDHRIHSRLIGARGKSINKVMEKYNVDIRFPRDKECDVVVISGLEENVEDAKDHILTIAEEYMQDIAEREQEEELRRKYTRASAEQENTKREENAIGFKIRDAPWSEGKEDFPVLGDGNAPPKKSQWGVGAIWSGAKAGPK